MTLGRLDTGRERWLQTVGDFLMFANDKLKDIKKIR